MRSTTAPRRTRCPRRRRCRSSTRARSWTASDWRRRSRTCTATWPAGRQAELHFEVGRGLAERLGYPGELLDAIPAEALASFAGVGHHLDLAALQPGEAVLDLGSGSGTDVFCAAVLVGRVGPRRRGGHHRRAARQGRAASGPRGVLAGRVRRGAHRGAALRRRELRRGPLQRRHQPLAGQGPRLRRGGAGPAARREAGDRRHRQRPSAQGAHEAQRRAVGRLHRRGDPPQQLPGGDRGARPAGARSCARTTTASSPSGRSTPAAPTRSRASRWSPPSAREPSTTHAERRRLAMSEANQHSSTASFYGSPEEAMRGTAGGVPLPRVPARGHRGGRAGLPRGGRRARRAGSCMRRRCRTSATSFTTSAGTAAARRATGPTART